MLGCLAFRLESGSPLYRQYYKRSVIRSISEWTRSAIKKARLKDVGNPERG
jgi:hypothetical protein